MSIKSRITLLFLLVFVAAVVSGCVPKLIVADALKVAPVFSINTPINGGYVNAGQVAAYALTGFCPSSEVGRAVVLSGVYSGSTTCLSSGTWSQLVDLSALPDGVKTLSATLVPVSGTPFVAVSQFTKITVIPTIAYLSSVPVSPSGLTTMPLLLGTTTGTQVSVVQFFSDLGCASLIGQGLRSSYISAGVAATVPTNSTTNIYGKAIDSAGNSSACTFLTAFTHKSNPPGDPSFLSFTPSPPSPNSTPSVLGLASSDAATIGFFSDSACTSSLGSGTRAAFVSTGIPITVSFNASSTVYAQSVDAASNRSNCVIFPSYLHDSIAPTAVATVTHAANFTSLTDSPAITWAGGGVDAGSGVARFEYAIGTAAGGGAAGSNVLAWTSAGAVPTLPITASGLVLADSTLYFVNVRVVDLAGNVSIVTSSTGWTAHSPSTPQISPSVVTLSINTTRVMSVTGGTGPYSFSVIGGAANGTVGAPATGTSTTYTAPATPGTYTVRVTDSLMQISDATVTVINDTTAPVIASFTLNSGAATTAFPTVSAAASATDNLTGVSQIFLSETGATPLWNAVGWQTYANPINFTLSATNGNKTVYAWVQDGSPNHNVSLRAQASIILDFGLPPTVSITAPLVTASTPVGSNLMIQWTCSATLPAQLATYPIASLQYTTDDGTTFTTIATNLENNLTATTGNYNWTIPVGLTGPYRILASCQSSAGVIANSYSTTMNTSGWSVFMGNPSAWDENVNALVANLTTGSVDPTLAGDKNNNIFYVRDHQINRIDEQTGNVTRFAGQRQVSGCVFSSGVDPLAGTTRMGWPNILGTTTDRSAILVLVNDCHKIFKIDTTTSVVTEMADITSVGLTDWRGIFLTQGKQLLLSAAGKIYKLDLTAAGNSPVWIIGDGTCTTNGALVNGAAAKTTHMRGGPTGACQAGAVFVGNFDASSIWYQPDNSGYSNPARYDGSGSSYTVGSNSVTFAGGVNPNAPGHCHAPDFTSNIYCEDANLTAGTIYTVNLVTPSIASANTYQPTAGGSTEAVGSLKDKMLIFNNANWILTASFSGSWTFTQIAGQPLPTLGNGSDPTVVGLSRPDDLFYNASTKMLWVGARDGGYIRRVDLSGASPITSTHFSSEIYGSNDPTITFPIATNPAGDRLMRFGGCAKVFLMSFSWNGAALANLTRFINGGCDYSGTAYPPTDGSSAASGIGAAAAGSFFSTFPGLYHSNGKAYFATADNSVTPWVSPMIFSSDRTVFTRVAGLAGSLEAYNGADNATSAVGAHLSRVWGIHEILSGANAGDLLIYDGKISAGVLRLRLVTIATESGMPKIYDLFDFSTVAGFAAAPSVLSVVYDESTEQSGILGSGNTYMITGTPQVIKMRPNSSMTGGARSVYDFTGTTINTTSGYPRLALTPGNLLVLQPNFERILRVAP